MPIGANVNPEISPLNVSISHEITGLSLTKDTKTEWVGNSHQVRLIEALTNKMYASANNCNAKYKYTTVTTSPIKIQNLT